MVTAAAGAVRLLLEHYRAAQRSQVASADGTFDVDETPYTYTPVDRFEPFEVVKAAHGYEHVSPTQLGVYGVRVAGDRAGPAGSIASAHDDLRRRAARIALVDRLVNKTGGVRSEATIQSDVRMLLLDPELGLAGDDLDVQLEAQVGRGKRIDVEVGCAGPYRLTPAGQMTRTGLLAARA